MAVGPQVTELLRQSREGDKGSRDHLFQMLQEDLRRLAAKILHQGFRRSVTMQTTVLVNSAVERLLERGALDAANRRHLFALLGRAMHDVLVEEARANGAVKRGANQVIATLGTDASLAASEQSVSPDELMALRVALDDLAVIDPAAAESVWLHGYCGRSFEQTAELMESTLARVRGEWTYGRAWIADRMAQRSSGKKD